MNLNNAQKRVLRSLSLICITSSILFFALESILKSFVYHHQISVFISFMIAPMMVLVLMKEPLRLGKLCNMDFNVKCDRKVQNTFPSILGIFRENSVISRCEELRLQSLGKIDKGFVYGIIVYLLLFLWVISYYFFNQEFFDVFRVGGWDYITFNILIIMNVMPVDFFSKRIIQLEIAKGFGEMNGMCVQIIVWMIGHVYELFWLRNLMGAGGGLLFIAVSGIITGFVYSKTKNVLGLMFGHWMLNLFVMLAVSLL